MWAFTWQFLMCQKSQAWPAVACKKNKKQKKNLHPKKEKSEFHPLIVFPYDCNVLHAWLCGPMSPLVSRPVWYAASSAIAMTLFPDLKPWGFRAKSALTQWVPPVLVWKVSWDIFWSVYAPNGISSFEKISCCGKLYNSKAAIIGKLVHFGVSQCTSFTCFHPSCSIFIPLLLIW